MDLKIRRRTESNIINYFSEHLFLSQSNCKRLESSLKAVVGLYVELVEGGDCGSWDPHTMTEIMEAEKLLKELNSDSRTEG